MIAERHGSDGSPSIAAAAVLEQRRRNLRLTLGEEAHSLSEPINCEDIEGGRDLVHSYSLTISTPTQLTTSTYLDIQTFSSTRNLPSIFTNTIGLEPFPGGSISHRSIPLRAVISRPQLPTRWTSPRLPVMLVACAVVAWTSRTKCWDDIIAVRRVTSLTIAGQSGC
jgi:hypothetical protein